MTVSKRRRGLTVASALLGGVLVLSACSGGDDSSSNGGGSDTSQAKADEAAAKKSSQAEIKITPKDGTDNASINNSAAVTVSKGTLTGVTMTTTDGAKVAGELATKTKATVKAEVREVGVRDGDADRVTLIIFVNQTTTSTITKGSPRVDLNRTRFTMVRNGDRWLVQEIAGL